MYQHDNCCNLGMAKIISRISFVQSSACCYLLAPVVALRPDPFNIFLEPLTQRFPPWVAAPCHRKPAEVLPQHKCKAVALFVAPIVAIFACACRRPGRNAERLSLRTVRSLHLRLSYLYHKYNVSFSALIIVHLTAADFDGHRLTNAENFQGLPDLKSQLNCRGKVQLVFSSIGSRFLHSRRPRKKPNC